MLLVDCVDDDWHGTVDGAVEESSMDVADVVGSCVGVNEVIWVGDELGDEDIDEDESKLDLFKHLVDVMLRSSNAFCKFFLDKNEKEQKLISLLCCFYFFTG